MNGYKKSPNNDERVFEKIKTTHLIYPSTLITIFIFVLTFYFYYKSGIILIPFLPFYSSYVFSYLFVLLVVYLITVFIFRTKAINMALFAPHVQVYGYHPLEFSSRLGVRYVDIFGLVISSIFCIITLFFLQIKMLFPGFLLFSLSFLSSLLFSNEKKWELKRRK